MSFERADADNMDAAQTAALAAHVAAADPHTGYRLESADHTHQSTGAQGGTLDHGLALTGLTDNDHTNYQVNFSAQGGTAAADLLTSAGAGTQTFSKTYDIPANTLVVGDIVRITAYGRVTDATGGGNWTTFVTADGATLSSTPTAAVTLNHQFKIYIHGIITAIGATGKMQQSDVVMNGVSTGLTLTGADGAITLDTTQALTIDVRVTFTAASPIVRLNGLSVEIVQAQ